MQLKVSGGTYSVNEKTNSIDFVYNLKSGIIQTGTFVKENGLFLSAGANAKASENATDLILENEILKIVIKKVGSKTGPQAINTSNLIETLFLKESNATVSPTDSSVTLDDFPDSSYGNGYSELVKAGDRLAKAEALVHVNANSVVYNIVYSL